MNILDRNNNIVLSTPINEGAILHYDLMGEHYIRIVFNTATPVSLSVGDYISTEYGIFELLDTNQCTYNTNSGGYEYSVTFHAYYRKWGNKIARYSPADTGSESGFSLTAPIGQHCTVITSNLSALGTEDEAFLYNFSDDFTCSFDSTVDTTVSKYINYENTSILDAISAIAEAFGCEWWVEGSVIHFGRCEKGTEVNMILGQSGENVESMSPSRADQNYATRIYAYGSERNLPPNYRASTHQTAVNGIVQRRLMLPADRCPNGYLQLGSVTNEVQAIEKVVIFDEEYPKVECEVGQVTTYESTVHNDDGSVTTKVYYRVTDVSGFDFSADMILDGETLHIRFETGRLAGMEFECHYNATGQYYEVVMNSDYGTELPNNILRPMTGDTFVLFGWDATMLEGTDLIEAAEDRLYELAAECLAGYAIDPNSYSVTAKTTLPMYGIGQRVKLVNKAYFQSGRSSRIIGVEFKLDIPNDHPQYIVGENAAYSRSGSLEEEIKELRIKGINNEYKNTSLAKYAHGFDYLKRALNESTSIEGGLILSSLIQLGYTNNLNERVTMSGMNGLYDTGKSIAFWAGGDMNDMEYPTAGGGSLAQYVMRMDGSGYMAGGNIKWNSDGSGSVANGAIQWDANGNITQFRNTSNTVISQFNSGIKIGNQTLVETDLVNISKIADKVDNSFFNKLFTAIDANGNAIPVNGSATPVRIRANFDFFSVGESSAFGIDSSGGGGGGTDLAAVWATLTGNTGTYKDYQIHSGHLTSALANYALSSSLATVATSGSYNDLTNKPTLNYLPLTGGTLSGNLSVTRSSTSKVAVANDNASASLYIASNNQRGLYDDTKSRWLVGTNGTNTFMMGGNVGINTSAPSYQLHVNGYSYATRYYANSENFMSGSTDQLYFSLNGVNPIVMGETYVRRGTTDAAAAITLGTSTYRWANLYSVLGNFSGQITSSVANGTAPLVVASSTLVSNLNADKLDGYEASGLFSSLTNSGNNISVTIGGTNKTLQVGYADNANSASTATTLKNSRTIWGQSFNGGANVKDTLYMLSSSATSLNNPSAKLKFNSYGVDAEDSVRRSPYIQALGGSSYGRMRLSIFQSNAANYTDDFVEAFTVLPNGNVGVNTSAPTYKLHVDGTGNFTGLLTASGNIKTASYIEIGDYRIVADTANTALKVVNKDGTTAVNFYATGENSALGVNTSGGGGGGDGASLEAVWTSLGSSTGTYGSSQINASHLTNALSSYATQSWVEAKGYLTSYTETDPVFKTSAAYGITSTNISTWNGKQDAISDLATIRSNASAGAAKVSNVQADWTATSGLAVILHKPTLATVATSGKYSDLTGTPTKVSTFTNDANYVTSSSLTTTLASYATTSAMNTELAKYLLLTGGTLSGNLEVSKSNAKVLANNGTSIVSLLNSTNRGVYDDTNSLWLIATNGTNTFLMDGNVGIGTNSPSYQLHVNGDAYATRYYANGGNSMSGSSDQLYFTVGSVNPIVMTSSAVRRGTSADAANITLGTSSYRWANLYSVLGNFSGQITSSVATGTSPLSVASTTLNENLNADLLDGYHATEVSRLGWVGVNNATGSSDQCKWYEVNVPTSSGSLYVYDIIAHRNAYPFVAYYRLAIYRYNTNIVSVSLINHGFNHKNANNTRVCVAIDSNQKVYIQSGSRTASNYMRIRPYYNDGGINTTAVGEAAFGTANGFTALKMITDSGYFRVDTSAATQSTAYDGDPMMITSLRLGNAYLWWDDANNCLRITGVNSNGVPASSVVVNVNVSGEVTALKTS